MKLRLQSDMGLHCLLLNFCLNLQTHCGIYYIICQHINYNSVHRETDK